MEGRVFLAFIEGVLRDSEHHNKTLDEMYQAAAAARRKPAPVDKTARRREIDKLTRLFGG